MAMTADGFRQTLRRWASGVTVVTMQEGSEIHGITVSAFLSVSLNPPLVLVSIDKKARSHERLLGLEQYGVSVLREGQQRLSNHFAGWDDAFLPEYEQLAGFPVIKGALAHLLCRTVERIDAGDHTLFLGQLEDLAWFEGEPLLYFSGKYREFIALEKDL
jgi:flavin reductase (DIM6/NTAB) family NADH-FMN oxidoreductase RutF